MNIARKQNVATFNGADLPQQQQRQQSKQRSNEQHGSKNAGLAAQNQQHSAQAQWSGCNGNNLTHMHENIFTSAVVAVIGECAMLRHRWANKQPERME